MFRSILFLCNNCDLMTGGLFFLALLALASGVSVEIKSIAPFLFQDFEIINEFGVEEGVTLKIPVNISVHLEPNSPEVTVKFVLSVIEGFTFLAHLFFFFRKIIFEFERLNPINSNPNLLLFQARSSP